MLPFNEKSLHSDFLDHLNGWEIAWNGGDGWNVNVTGRNAFPDSTLGITHCFVTSF